jgi:DNA-binding MarR family transcriptional regulator
MLNHLARAARRSSEAALEPTGLRPRHLVALTILRDRGAMTQVALGEALHLDPTNLVGLLNELERESLLERRRDVLDRRRHIVEISDAGRSALTSAERALASVEDQVLAGLDEACASVSSVRSTRDTAATTLPQSTSFARAADRAPRWYPPSQPARPAMDRRPARRSRPREIRADQSSGPARAGSRATSAIGRNACRRTSASQSGEGRVKGKHAATLQARVASLRFSAIVSRCGALGSVANRRR